MTKHVMKVEWVEWKIPDEIKDRRCVDCGKGPLQDDQAGSFGEGPNGWVRCRDCTKAMQDASVS